MGRMFGGKGAPDAAELEKMQAELAKLDPNAIPAELKDMMQGGALPEMPKLPAGLPGLAAASFRALGGLPGLGGPPFRGLSRLAGQEEMTWLSIPSSRPTDCACASGARTTSIRFYAFYRDPAIDGGLWPRCQAQRRVAPHCAPHRPLAVTRLWPLGARRQGDRQIRRLWRPVVSRWLGRCRGRLWHRAGIPRAGLCRGSGQARARLRLSRKGHQTPRQLHQSRATRRRCASPKSSAPCRMENSSCTAAVTSSICIPNTDLSPSKEK